jgi:hypothetical protein
MRHHASSIFRSPLTIFPFFLQLLLVPRLFSQQPSSNSSSCPCALHGVVLDSVTGNPIRNALVQASAASTWSALTDSEGKFQLDALPGGPIILRAAKPGYLYEEQFGPWAPRILSLDVGPDSAPATLKLTPEGVISGRVTDENGEPLENFSVSLVHRNLLDQILSMNNPKQILTDDEGKFRIAGLPPGLRYLSVSATQNPALTSTKIAAAPQGFPLTFYPSATDLGSAIPIKILPGRPSQVNVTLRREPFVRLSGTVSGYSPEQRVVLSLQNSMGEQVREGIPFDASTGSFQTDWIPPGAYNLSALTQGSAESSHSPSFARQFLNANSTLSGIHLVLQPSVNITYVVHGFPSADHEQGESPRLSLVLAPKGPDSRSRIFYSLFNGRSTPATSASPSAVLEAIEPGTYEVRPAIYPMDAYYVESLSCGSTDLLHNPLILDSSGAAPTIEVFVQEGAAKLTGRVISGGQPSPAVVVVFPPDKRIPPEFASAGSDGTFMRIGLSPGVYRVVAVDYLAGLDLEDQDVLRILSSKAQEVTLAPGQSTSLRLELTKVQE